MTGVLGIGASAPRPLPPSPFAPPRPSTAPGARADGSRVASLRANETRLTHVVIQGRAVGAPLLAEWVRRLEPRGSVVPLPLVTGQAWRLHDVGHLPEDAPEALEALGRRQRLDVAVVPGDRALAAVGFVASDMDSTLIQGECIDAIAAKWQALMDEDEARAAAPHGERRDVGREVEAITARAMRGELHFAESLKARVSVLEGLPETALAQVYEAHVRLTPGAREMVSTFHSVEARIGVLSGGFTHFTQPLKAALELELQRANVLEVRQGRLTGRLQGDVFDAQAKADTVHANRSRDRTTVAVGDGSNDIPMLVEADVGIAFHAKPGVREKAVAAGGTVHALNEVGLDGVPNLFLARSGSLPAVKL